MTRRDIIIVAVLANIAVLAILFMLAFRTDENRVEDPPEIAYSIEEPSVETFREPEMELVKMDPTDEVDLVIEELTAINNNDSIEVPEEVEEKISLLQDEVTSDVEMVEVKVKNGDALEKIARANGTTVEAIMRENKLTSDRLKIGQLLRVPLKTVEVAQVPPKTIVQRNIQYYTIKNGDNPWKIAKQFNVRVDELLFMNNLDEDTARKLKAGDQIRVR